MKKPSFYFLLSTLSFLLSPFYFLLAQYAHAQVDISGLTYPGQKIQNSWSIGQLLTGGGSGFNIISFIFFLAGLSFFVSLLSAAWEYITSQGDPKKFSSATTRFINSFMGIVIVLASFIIVRVVLSVLNIQNTF